MMFAKWGVIVTWLFLLLTPRAHRLIDVTAWAPGTR